MEKKFVEKYPGKLTAYVNHPEKVDEYVVYCNQERHYTPSSEYERFFTAYVVNGNRLDAVAALAGLHEHSVSSWASDELGTYLNWEKQFDKKEEPKKVEPSKKSVDAETMQAVQSLYKQAETMDADYYDFNTGRIYHIQEYNRLKKFGLPTIGIRITVDGEEIGYVPKPETLTVVM